MSEGKGGEFAMVTGCGQGSIGEALAREFVKHGYSVIATLLSHEDDSHLKDVPRCHMYRCDVTSDDDVGRLPKSVEDLTGGRLDILGNNAGLGYKYPAVDSDLQMAERLLAVHVLGPIRVVKYFHRLVIRTKGIIFNTTSVSAIFPTPYSAVYGASKAALYKYGDTLRVELRPFGVRVVNVLDGEVRTNITKPGLSLVIDVDSVYLPMQERFKAKLDGNQPKMTAEDFAVGVVKHLLAPRPGMDFWYGAYAPMAKHMHWLLPQWAISYVAYSMYHLDELRIANA